MSAPTNATVLGVPRAEVGVWILLLVGWVAAFFAGSLFHQGTIVRHETTRLTIQQQYGKPDASIAGATVNKGLAGLTCDLWRAKAVVICHR